MMTSAGMKLLKTGREEIWKKQEEVNKSLCTGTDEQEATGEQVKTCSKEWVDFRAAATVQGSC